MYGTFKMSWIRNTAKIYAFKLNFFHVLGKLLGQFLPNTYYSRPKFRYPYYDRNGQEWTNIV
jgi:hypothetical protein